jgi:GH24 family phage-related lysozyme (muramidase)
MIIEQASNLIQCWSDFYTSPTLINNTWHIGWGAVRYVPGVHVKETDQDISVARANEILSVDLTGVADKLYKDYPYWRTLSVSRKVALISFAYSTGYNFGSEDHLELNHALEFDLDSVPEVFSLYNETLGVINDKLNQRRKCEGLIWDGIELSAALMECHKAQQEKNKQANSVPQNQNSEPACPMPESTAKKIKKGLTQKLDM